MNFGHLALPSFWSGRRWEYGDWVWGLGCRYWHQKLRRFFLFWLLFVCGHEGAGGFLCVPLPVSHSLLAVSPSLRCIGHWRTEVHPPVFKNLIQYHQLHSFTPIEWISTYFPGTFYGISVVLVFGLWVNGYTSRLCVNGFNAVCILDFNAVCILCIFKPQFPLKIIFILFYSIYFLERATTKSKTPTTTAPLSLKYASAHKLFLLALHCRRPCSMSPTGIIIFKAP